MEVDEMLCPNCGLENQQAGAYCRRCGATQQVKKERTAGMVSVALSLIAAAILLWAVLQPDVRYGRGLGFAAVCSLLVAAYHALNLYLGRDVFELIMTRPLTGDAPPRDQIYTQPPSALNPTSFKTADLPISSVTENTTRTLEPVERQGTK